MSMFSRISDIVQANINAILDKAEDPQKVVRLIIQEMQETMVEVRSVAARHIADKKVLSRKIDKLQESGNNWQYKAQIALEKGREDLARAAIQQKQANEREMEQLNHELSVVEENLAKLQDDTSRLADKIAEAKARQKALNVRQQSVSVRLKAKASEHVDRIDDAIARFEQYERKIDDLESEVEAYDFVETSESLESQFRALEEDDQVEQELAELRKKVA